MHRRFPLVLTSLLALALAISACSSGSPTADAAATVNGEEIPNALFEEVSDDALGAGTPTGATEGATDAPTPDPEVELQTRRQALSQLINNAIVVQFAAEQGVELDDAAIQEIIDEGSEEFTAQAETSGLDQETFAEVYLGPQYLLDQIARNIAGEIDVTDEQLQERVGQMSATGEGITATVSHILVDTEEAANEALARIEGGEAFADVAAEVSTDGSSAQGGLLGEDVPLSQFVPEFAGAAATADIGVPTGPVQSQFGWHLILVDARSELDLEGMEEDLRDQIALDSEEGQAALQPLIEEFDAAYTDAEVEVSSRYGAWDPTARAVVGEDEVGESTDEAPAPATTPTP